LKVKPECAACIVHRGIREIIEATEDEKVRFNAVNALLKFLAENFTPEGVPADLGTQRDRIIKRVTGNPDPYKRKKQLSNQKALELLPKAKKLVENAGSPEERFRKACLCAIVGNLLEFDIPDHVFTLEELEAHLASAEKDLAIDEIAKIREIAAKAGNIIYLTDNAGEIVFDTLLVKELRSLGAQVTVAVKGGPIINDATMEDAETAGMNRVADAVIDTGTDSVGLNREESSEEFLKAYDSADLVIAKGMGYAESLTELKLEKPHALLFRTKCNPVAEFFQVPKGKNVAKLLPEMKGENEAL